jgi:threonine aldolase
MNFASDNTAGVAPEILDAIVAANAGYALGYGNDDWTLGVERRLSEIFEREVAAFLVPTGTAANALALSQVVPPYGAVYCHDTAHIVTDECGAPEFFTGGAKMMRLPGADGKITPAQVADAVAFAEDMGVHHVKPAGLSLSQATEWGTVYGLAEVSALAAVAKRYDLPVHMDGARLANALVHLGCTPAEATWKSGVDVLSLGATKNGALCAEAVIFFDRQRARDFERRRKQAGHLWSKLRFVSAQLVAYFENGLWLANAGHANAMAQALAQGLGRIAGASLLQPVDANEVFVALPEATVAALENQGFGFYRWPLCPVSEGVAIRLVTSYATPQAQVDEFLAAAGSVADG